MLGNEIEEILSGRVELLFLRLTAPTALVTEVQRAIPIGVAATGRTLNAVGKRLGMIVVVHRFDNPNSFIAAS